MKAMAELVSLTDSFLKDVSVKSSSVDLIGSCSNVLGLCGGSQLKYQ